MTIKNFQPILFFTHSCRIFKWCSERTNYWSPKSWAPYLLTTVSVAFAWLVVPIYKISWDLKNYKTKRMHSSRMRTARWPPLDISTGGGGVMMSLFVWSHVPSRGCLVPGGMVPPPANRMTDMCKNNLPATSFAGGKKCVSEYSGQLW